MSLRIIELIIPDTEDIVAIKERLTGKPVVGMWEEDVSEIQQKLRILVDSGHSGDILDLLEKKYSKVDGFRIVLLPVEATLPKVEEEKKEQKKEKTEFKIGKGISRAELYGDVTETSETTKFFVFLVILSTLVATIGILKNNVAIIIGAMVIAPLIGPNIALALATTLGDGSLLRKSIKSNLVGFAVALIISLIIGFLITVNPTTPELLLRTKSSVGDIVLALASGSAGALSYTMGLPSAIIGVMVAVALLPPTVSLGLLLGAGYNEMALGALILLLINIICVNLSAVATFLFQGVQPLNWWDKSKAKKATKFAILIWTILLIFLFLLVAELF